MAMRLVNMKVQQDDDDENYGPQTPVNAKIRSRVSTAVEAKKERMSVAPRA
jgi:hypothetical protein